MEGSPVANEGGGVISPVHKFREYLQLRQRGNANEILPGRHRPARCGNPNDIGLPLIGWGSDIGASPTREMIYKKYGIHICIAPCPFKNSFQ